MITTHDQVYINGVWHTPNNTQFTEVIDSSTEAVLARVCLCSEDEVSMAVSAAKDAFSVWSAYSPERRQGYLMEAQAKIAGMQEEIALLIAREVGTPMAVSRMFQAGFPAAVSNMYAEMAATLGSQEQAGNAVVVREPIGVVACITPWNFPLHQVIAKVFPALAAGCTVVLKPSEIAPLSAFLLTKIFDDIGLPAGVFNLITGFGHDVGTALVGHEDVDMVSFTGSTGAGKAISKIAANTVKRVSLELGGKSAAIILDDADLTTALTGALQMGLLNSGQTCIAHTRILVPAARYEEAQGIAAAIIDSFPLMVATEEGEGLGPLISAAHRERVLCFIDKGIGEGATLLCGGVAKPAGFETGFFVKPTLFADVTPQMTIAREEIFGPVICLMSYEDDRDAVHIANDSIYGLSGGVWCNDEQRAEQVARQLRTGQVHINGAQLNPLAPFGGYKQSGNGRELGKYGLEEFLELKAIFK